MSDRVPDHESHTTPRNEHNLTSTKSDPGPNGHQGQGDNAFLSDPTANRSSRLSRMTSTAKKNVEKAFKLESQVNEDEKKLWDMRTRSFLSRQKGGLKKTEDQADSGSKVRPTILQMTFPSVYNAAKRFKSDKDVQTAQGTVPVRYRPSDMAVDGDRSATAVLLVGKKAISSPPASPIGDQPDHIIGDAVRFARDIMAPVADEDYSSFFDHRPFFTWFVIVSQTLILVLSLLLYGFGPWGFTTHTYSKKVVVPSLSLQEVEYGEPSNVWLGPPAAALVRLGAKFAPCMRRDRLVFRNIEKDRMEERKTACCIRNDESGCAQTTADKCSELLSVFNKWDARHPGPVFRLSLGPNQFTKEHRVSGTVCGQDPRNCESPASTHPHEWPDDITKWPLCTRPIRSRLSEPHMSCEVIARPCCIGIYGQCHITTQEFCDHVKGHFHEEATLCSQVSCMKDVCGLVSFMDDEKPDQFYRSFLSMFLHAGILHLTCSLAFYILFMQSVEQMIGPTRMAVIYLGSGIGGNLASAAFVPYRAEVGPAGPILGVMACSIVVILWNWELLEEPARNLSTKLIVTSFFFLMGLVFPWIDNYAHLAGFLVGMCLSLLLIPFMGVKSSDEHGQFTLRRRKQCMVLFGSVSLLFMFVVLSVLVWVTPIYDCDFCKYFNCFISLFNSEICPDQDIRITRLDIL